MTYQEAIELVKKQKVAVRRPHWKYHNCIGAWKEGHNAGPHCIKPRWDGRTIVVYYCGLGRIEETFLREYVKDEDRAATDWEVFTDK
jgi:hypothetical protein